MPPVLPYFAARSLSPLARFLLRHPAAMRALVHVLS